MSIDVKLQATKQPAIETEMIAIGERLEILSKSLANLEDRLTMVCNENTGVEPTNDPNSQEMYKAASPMKDRLSNFLGTINGLIHRVNSTIAKLEL